jgi:DNA-binding NarL/FixJ family response regulator
MNKTERAIKVALADDHVLLRDALAALINNFGDCEVIFTATNGLEVLEKIEESLIPDVLILDLNMPLMDGYQTASWLHSNYPKLRILLLTMYDSEITLIRMLKAGVNGFLKKDVHPQELHFAIMAVLKSDYYYNNGLTGRLVNAYLLEPDNPEARKAVLNEQEIQFLKLSCTELSYKEISAELKLNPRGADRLREILFAKLGVKTRVGLAMFAIRHGLISF